MCMESRHYEVVNECDLIVVEILDGHGHFHALVIGNCIVGESRPSLLSVYEVIGGAIGTVQLDLGNG